MIPAADEVADRTNPVSMKAKLWVLASADGCGEDLEMVSIGRVIVGKVLRVTYRFVSTS